MIPNPMAETNESTNQLSIVSILYTKLFLFYSFTPVEFLPLDHSITLTSSRGLRPRVGGARIRGLRGFDRLENIIKSP